VHEANETTKQAGAMGKIGNAIWGERAILAGLASVLVLYTVGPSWLADLSNGLKYAVLFIWIFAVMLWLAFRAVTHAEALAHILGEPLGTIILTLAVICIEVALVAMVSLTGKGTPTLARDTMFAVVMVVLNGMVGLNLLLGGLRHHEQQYDLRGANAYLSVILPLSVLGLILPRVSQAAPGGEVTRLFGIFLALTAAGLYVVFLMIQTGRHQSYFREPPSDKGATVSEDGGHHDHHPIYGVAGHAVLLLMSLLPIVLMSKKLAVLLDYGVARLGAPAALGGLVVAMLVLTPEGVAAFRATMANQLQRTINLLFGAALSTIGLTIPAVMIVQWFTGGHLELGLESVQAVLLALTLGVCIVHFGGRRTTVLQGAVHLVLFVAYLMLIFD
jgi:Ca2+:H+ antiporter